MNQHHNGGGGVASPETCEIQQEQAAPAPSQSESTNQSIMSHNNSMRCLKSLAMASAMTGQGQGGDNGVSNENKSEPSATLSGSKGFGNNMNMGSNNCNANGNTSSNVGVSTNNNGFHSMQNNSGSDRNTGPSRYDTRRVSKDSLIPREPISDTISANQVASSNLDMMMSMMTNNNNSQQQQHHQGMAMGNQANSMNGLNFNGNGGSAQQQMSQLMMNGGMNNMNSMSQMQNQSMMNNGTGNSMGGGGAWNAKNGNANSITMNDPTLHGPDNGGNNSHVPLVIPPKKTTNKHKQTFAQKLMHILSLRECHNAIRWMPNGCAFCIVDSKALLDSVLPKYFKEAKYTSFTRKLNRWGFKHFTLPTASDPSADKEMSIYTHEKFLRDNPNLCQQMDGGHRRRNSQKESSEDEVSHAGLESSQGPNVASGIHQDNMAQQLQQQNAMMQQMQQLQQQNMLMQQLQQQQLQQQQHQQMGQNQANQAPTFDMSALNSMGGNGGVPNLNSMMGSFNNNASSMGNQGNMNSLMDGQSTMGGAAMGMRRTSLGFMPYIPASNRRDSGFSIGGLSMISKDGVGNTFNGGAGLGGIESSHQSLEKFHKMSPSHNQGGDTSNAMFDAYKGSSAHNGNAQEASPQGVDGGNTGNGDGENGHGEHLRHSQAKLAVLEDMIAKVRMEQSLISGRDQNAADL